LASEDKNVNANGLDRLKSKLLNVSAAQNIRG